MKLEIHRTVLQSCYSTMLSKNGYKTQMIRHNKTC